MRKLSKFSISSSRKRCRSPLQGEFTHIYGGKRAIDYSQFQPRGHYLKTVPLSRYFRTMMWLGRADTGWNVLPPDRQSGIVSDTPARAAKCRPADEAIAVERRDRAIAADQRNSRIHGRRERQSDRFSNGGVAASSKKSQASAISRRAANRGVSRRTSSRAIWARNRIRSQVVLSDPTDLYQVPPPSTYQMFGQRFVVDSFVLSKVVYDSIIFDGKKVQRKMPTGWT